jgi:multicomponent Na+:H+ antiporter subunit E
MRIVPRIALLVGLWLLAWGDLTLANVLSGVVVAGLLLIAFPLGRAVRSPRRISVVGAGILASHVGVQLVVSNIVMAREILRRTPRDRPGVLAHRLLEPSEEVVTVMTSIISLSPGTMTVDVDDGSSTIYVHFFQLDDVAAARAFLRKLERLVVAAIPLRRAGSVDGSPTPEVSP